ncbi:LPXTG cell wall anchor domain-containing protein [Enterococcus hulanensis]|uniref:LPXTG cell wall anchor domain-containing protein n=1 Tax=Enterococcus hulanensis TaxID=2559929 RepID=UPI0010F727E4|nr:LPXTG cell wall anchor domain-containing protein [Enterococcus hulanensis]
MFRKSVHLFSVALLGLALVPSNVWADEVVEPAAPSVTTELIESPAAVAEQPAPEAEVGVQPEAEVVVEEPEITEPSASEPSEAGVEESSEAPEDEPEETATPNPEMVNSEQTAEPIAAVQPKAARAAAPALKDDYDGKIVDHEKAITNEKAKIPAEYNFMPNFDHLDDIIVNASSSYFDRMGFFVFNLKNESANSITVLYKNVGSYNGKVIDMKVTVKDWTVFAGSLYNQLYIHKKNGITMRGISDVRLNYTFLDNLTSAAVNVSGFFNFTDIDLLQSIDLFDHNNVQNYYVAKGNELYFKTYNGYIKIGEINRTGTDDDDENFWLTYTYKNVSNFDVRYNQDYDSGAVFNYTYQAPVVIEETPTKSESKEPEIIEEAPKEEITVDEPKEAKTETTTVNLAAKTEKVEPVKAEIKEAVKEAEPLKQAVLPQTNDQSSSIFAILGGTCLFLLGALFLNKKKV